MWRGAALALGLAAAMPARTGDLRSHPAPARGYEETVKRARNLIAADDSVVSEGGSSILRVHGHRTPRVVILLHGFTNSPREFAGLADSLFAAGDNVLVPRLPRHAIRGKNVAELSNLTASELCRTADAAVDIAAGLGDSIVTMGLSVGGTLALWAAEYRIEVRRAVVIAPPFEVGTVPSILEKPLINLGAHVPNVSRRSASDSARPDRLPGFTTHARSQVLRLSMAVRREAEQRAPMRAEALFLVNAHDRTVKTAPVLDIARELNRHGSPALVYELPDSLGLPHNFIDPAEPSPASSAATPVLMALAHGEAPPRWLGRRR